MRKFGKQGWQGGERRIQPSRPLYGTCGVPSKAIVKESLERELRARPELARSDAPKTPRK